MTHNIIIVGAGYAGIASARYLAKTFKKQDDVTITLIDKNSFQTYMTELHEVAAGRVEPEAIKYDLQRIFKKYPKVQLVTDKVVAIDYERKQVQAEHQSLDFDYLILAMGGEANDFGTPGVKEHGFSLWSIEAAEALHYHILDTCYRAMKEHDVAKRRALLTFTVIGAGFTGIEMIGELIDWVPILAKQFKLDVKDFSLKVVEAMPSILNMVTEKEQTKAQKYLIKKGVELVLADGVASVEEDALYLSSGRKIDTYTSIWTAGVKANTDTSEFDIEKARGGRLVANQYMETLEHPNVYVAGDLVYYEDQNQDGKPTPQIVQAAEQTGKTAAQNIAASIKKTEKVAKSTDDKAMLKDGTYKAESAFDERGWKVVHTITVADGKITASNFGYENKDGKLKADDEEYNKNMKAKSGVSSKEATEKLNSQLVEKQNLDDVEVVSGATHTSENFKKSTEALLEAAKEGKTDTIDLGK